MLDALLSFAADESQALSWLPVVSANHECLHFAVCRGTNLIPSLIEFLKAQDPKEEEEKKTALLGVLREINNALQKSDGPYFGGQDVNAADLRVPPAEACHHWDQVTKGVHTKHSHAASPCAAWCRM